MAISAREVGQVGIRALPLTDNFRQDLLKKLRRIEKQTHFQVNVDRARVDRQALQRHIQRHLDAMRGATVTVQAKFSADGIQKKLNDLADRDLTVRVQPDLSPERVQQQLRNAAGGEIKIKFKPHIDEVFANRMRTDLQRAVERIEQTIPITGDTDPFRRQLNALIRESDLLEGKLAQNILSGEESAKLRMRLHQIKDALDDVAKDREARVDANPFTAWAAARLSWLTRPRFVEIIPRVSKSAMTQALTALSALSGARLSWHWIDKFNNWFKELDKRLPRIVFGTTGLATAFAGIMGSISGIVGIGDGLAATTHSLLLAPGLLAGAVLSGVTIYRAMKDASDQLDELGDSYTNLGQIISTTFWKEARQPIIDFSNSVMPQLERSFEKTSAAIGRFTAQLAADFQREFANGRLEAMFDGLAASWDELSKGTEAFAGAITNLGLVAARYMPRLAAWFVRQADTFDNWLSEVATDGRLDMWIQESIDAFYALWDVMAATTGIFQALWKAAEAGGAGGLRGFADMLLTWEKHIQGDKWQETLTSLFRGSEKALSGISKGLQSFGNTLHGLREPLEYLIGESGQGLGRFISSISDALNTPEIARGIKSLTDGLTGALDAFAPALEPLSDAFADLMDFVGRLAPILGETLGSVLAELAPLFSTLLDVIEPLVPILADALVEAVEMLVPALQDLLLAIDFEELVTVLADAFLKVVEAIVPILPELGEMIQIIVDGLVPILPDLGDALIVLSELFLELWDAIKPHLPALLDLAEYVIKIAVAFLEMWSITYPVVGLFVDLIFTMVSTTIAQINSALGVISGFAESMGALFRGDIPGAVEAGKSAINKAMDFKNVTEEQANVWRGFGDRAKGTWDEMKSNAENTASEVMKSFDSEFKTGNDRVVGTTRKLNSNVKREISNGLASSARRAGADFGAGFANGISGTINQAAWAAARLARSALNAARAELDIHSPSRKADRMVGREFGAGIAQGIERSRAVAKAATLNLVGDMETGLGALNATTNVAAGSGSRAGVSKEINLTFVNPIERDWAEDALSRAEEVGGLL